MDPFLETNQKSTAVAFSSDSKLLATAGWGRIVLWDTATWKKAGELER